MRSAGVAGLMSAITAVAPAAANAMATARPMSVALPLMIATLFDNESRVGSRAAMAKG